MVFSRVDFEGVWPVEPLEIDEDDSRIRMPWWVTRVRWSIAAEGTQHDPSLKVGCNSFLFVTDKGNKRIEVWRQELLQALTADRTSRYDCSTMVVSMLMIVLSLWSFKLCSARWVVIWFMFLLGTRTVPELFVRPHWALTAAYREVLKCIGASIILIICLHLFELASSVNCGTNWASDCSECPPLQPGVPWCEGDCMFYDGSCIPLGASLLIEKPLEAVEDRREAQEQIPEEPHEFWDTPESQPDTDSSSEAKAEVNGEAVDGLGATDEQEDDVATNAQQDKEDDDADRTEPPMDLPVVKQPEMPHDVVWATDAPPLDVSDAVTDQRAVRHTVYSETPIEGNPLVVLACFFACGTLWKSGVLFNNNE